jgi:hypothetical protein
MHDTCALYLSFKHSEIIHVNAICEIKQTLDHLKHSVILQFKVALDVCHNDLALSGAYIKGKFMTVIYHCPLLDQRYL